MVNKFIVQCLEMLESDEVKNHCKSIASPFIQMFFTQMMPYIYFITFFVILCFILNLATFLILFKKRNTIKL